VEEGVRKMSENVGTGTGVRQFGRIVAQTAVGEVFSLNLFETTDETPDLICRGFYLPPPDIVRRVVRENPEDRPFGPMPEVELRALWTAREELLQSTAVVQGAGLDPLPERFEVNGMGLEVEGELMLASRLEGGEVWTGTIGDYTSGAMSFVLERYGSPEVILVILTIFVLIHWDRRADELDEECLRRAIENCGYRRIKRFKVRRTLASFSEPGGFSHDCDFECK
jgi:hypothetical protein